MVLISIVSVGPAVWSQNAELVREKTIQLILAAIATALCLVERSYGRRPAAKPAVVTELAATPRGAPWFRRSAKGTRVSNSSDFGFAVARP